MDISGPFIFTLNELSSNTEIRKLCHLSFLFKRSGIRYMTIGQLACINSRQKNLHTWKYLDNKTDLL